MDPLFETRNAMGGLLAISSASEYPEKALEFINLLNTDEYVGTLIRHGIEGEHYTAVGDTQVDRTMGGTLDPRQTMIIPMAGGSVPRSTRNGISLIRRHRGPVYGI